MRFYSKNIFGCRRIPSRVSDIYSNSSFRSPQSPSLFYLYDPVQGGTHFGMTCPSGNACAYIMPALLENTNHPHANPGCNGHFPPHNYCIGGGGVRFNTP